MKKFHLVFRISACALILGAVAWLLRPCYSRWSQDRGERLALAYLEKLDLANASVCARRVLQLASNSAPACRVLAAVEDTKRSPRALEWRQRVIDLQPKADSNRIALARSALLQDRPDVATLALAGMAQDHTGTNANFHDLSAQVAFAKHDLITAEQRLTTAAVLDPSNVVHTVNLAIVRLHGEDSNLVARSRHELESWRTHSLYGTPVLRALAREALARSELPRARELSGELQMRPDLRFTDRLLHLEILQKLAVAERPVAPGGNSTAPVPLDATFAASIRRAQDDAGSNLERTCALAGWLLNHSLAEAIVPWIETLPEHVRQTTAIRLIQTHCQLVMKNWRELANWLKEGHWGADEHLRHALLALVYRQENENELATIAWKRAVHACYDGTQSVPKSQLALVRLAGAWSWENEAEALLWQIASGPETRWALGLLQRAYELSGNTHALLRVFQAESIYNPSDLVVRNNLAATSLLLQTNLVNAHQMAREAFLAHRTNVSMASTYAYSLHLQGRTDEGLELLSAFPEDARANPSTAAYYGFLLAEKGATGAAGKYLTLAQNGRLLPEERQLVETAAKQRTHQLTSDSLTSSNGVSR